jgi:hypothetical protein
VGGDKNEINPLVMTVYRPSDKRVDRVSSSLPEASKYVDAEPDSPLELEIVKYSAPATVVRDRLELMGFTLPTAHAIFQRAARAEGVRHRRVIESIRSQLGPDFEDEMVRFSRNLPRRPGWTV